MSNTLFKVIFTDILYIMCVKSDKNIFFPMLKIWSEEMDH